MAVQHDDELQELLRLASGSKRSFDLILVSLLRKLDTRLETIDRTCEATHNAVFGVNGGLGLVQKMAIITCIAVTVAGSWTWIWDKVTGVATKPIFGARLQEKWVKESTKRVRIFNKQTGKWEYYYAIEESKDE